LHAFHFRSNFTEVQITKLQSQDKDGLEVVIIFVTIKIIFKDKAYQQLTLITLSVFNIIVKTGHRQLCLLILYLIRVWSCKNFSQKQFIKKLGKQ